MLQRLPAAAKIRNAHAGHNNSCMTAPTFALVAPLQKADAVAKDTAVRRDKACNAFFHHVGKNAPDVDAAVGACGSQVVSVNGNAVDCACGGDRDDRRKTEGIRMLGI